MLNFHRISGMHIVIVSCDEADQIRTDSVFEMAKGRYYIRQDIKAYSNRLQSILFGNKE